MNRVRRLVLPLVAAACVFPLDASAFSEDLCVDSTTGKISNCLVDEHCNPFLGPTPRCRIHLFMDATQASAAANIGLSRSMLHVDTTYFLARALGISYRAAYWIAAYDEVADIGAYEPFGNDGKVLMEEEGLGLVAAVRLNGWARNFPYTSSWSYHMPAPYRPDTEKLVPDCVGEGHADDNPNEFPICGARPDLHDVVHEGMIVHSRDWAFNFRKSTDVHKACAAGFTVADRESHFTGPICYKSDPRLVSNSSRVTKYIQGEMPVLKGFQNLTFPFEAFTGRQIAKFSPPDTVLPVPLPGAPMPDLNDVRLADNLPAIIVEEVPPQYLTEMLDGRTSEQFSDLIRMGIYLHILQDRISHHVCGDRSSVTGPDAGGYFHYGYDDAECGQDIHAYYHYQELGQADLPLRTVTSLEYTFDELRIFAARFPYWVDEAPPEIDPLYQAKLIVDLSQVLLVNDGCERLKAMIELIDSYGFEQMPGHSADPASLDAMCQAVEK